MAASLKRALMEILTDWPDDLPPEWRDACGEVELGFHPVGTCEMGNDDMAVLDARLEVRDVGRLRVVDASAVPIISSGNTNAPGDHDRRKGRRVHSGGSCVMIMNPARLAPVVAMARV